MLQRDRDQLSEQLQTAQEQLAAARAAVAELRSEQGQLQLDLGQAQQALRDASLRTTQKVSGLGSQTHGSASAAYAVDSLVWPKMLGPVGRRWSLNRVPGLMMAQVAWYEAQQAELQEALSLARRELEANSGSARRHEQQAVDLQIELRSMREVRLCRYLPCHLTICRSCNSSQRQAMCCCVR